MYIKWIEDTFSVSKQSNKRLFFMVRVTVCSPAIVPIISQTSTQRFSDRAIEQNYRPVLSGFDMNTAPDHSALSFSHRTIIRNPNENSNQTKRFGNSIQSILQTGQSFVAFEMPPNLIGSKTHSKHLKPLFTASVSWLANARERGQYFLILPASSAEIQNPCN